MSAKYNTPATAFEHKEYDASINMCCWICLCPLTFGVIPYKTILTLDSEEVTRTDVTLCGKSVSKQSYGEIGSVDKGNCCCFVSVGGGVGEINPGCGCDNDKVDEIVTDLKARIRGRGDTAQIRRQEDALKRLDVVDAKLDLILQHMNIPTSELMTDRN